MSERNMRNRVNEYIEDALDSLSTALAVFEEEETSLIDLGYAEDYDNIKKIKEMLNEIEL